MNILVIRFSSVGDLVLLNPVFKILKEDAKNTVITLVTKKTYRGILKNNPYINNFFYLGDRDKSLNSGPLNYIIRKLNKTYFDIIFDMHRNLRSFILSALIRKNRIYKVKKDTLNRFLLVKFKINTFKEKKRVIDKYLETLKMGGINTDNKIDSGIYTGKKAEQRADKIISTTGKGSKLIGIAPGAKWNTKIWPYYDDLIYSLSKRRNINIILIGAKDDIKKTKLYGSNIINLIGKLNIEETASIIKKLDILVCNDTGVMHIADGYGVKTVAIFGPTVEEFGFFPFNKNSTVIEKSIACRPCSLHGGNRFPKNNFKCMKLINSSEVERVVLEKIR